MNEQQTATVRYVHVVLQHLKRSGFRRSEFLKSLDIPLEFMKGNVMRLPVSQIEYIWQKARELTQQEALGLLCADPIVLPDYGIMAHYWMNCENLLEAFDGSRFHEKLMHTGMIGTLKLCGEDTYQYSNHTRASNRWLTAALVELDFLSVLRVGQQLVSPENTDKVRVKHVYFTHAPNADEALYQQLFQCPVSFNASRNEMLVDKHVLELKVHSPDPSVKNMLLDNINELIQKTVHVSISSQVEEMLQQAQQQSLVLKLPDIAAKLKMSASTLKRKIQEENSSFSEIDKRVKLTTAKRLIYQNKLSIEQIAELLQYKDSTSFHRAFKGWTGCTPKQFRQQKSASD
ncbi:AraC family transcriptional regulator ligand-binding domain-containing protein [Bacterioplanoides sp.]|uniref:AraC family transcriptional regulator n=1 Tax=Bacterioplanoides sp. TaxID=2066072 RepID=UPI003B5A73CE